MNPNDPGKVSFLSSQYGASIEVPDGSGGHQGTFLHVSQANNTINEKWQVIPSNGGYAIKTAINGLAFNVFGGVCNNGDKIALWPYEGRRNDIWAILPA